MKIFFNASVSGRKIYLEHYQKIFTALKQVGQSVATCAFESSPEKISRETVDEAEAYFAHLDATIKRSDIGIFEVSYPSLGIGYEVARFVDLGKPVAVFHVPEKTPYILESMRNDRVHVIEYTLEEVGVMVLETVNYMKDQLNSRFTMIMPPEISHYLDELVRHGLSRSEYIRELIAKDMKRRGK